MKLIHTALAQVHNPLIPNAGHYANPSQYTSSILRTVVSMFFVVGILYFIWHFSMAAYHMIASEGDSKKFQDAKLEIEHALMGIFIVFVVYVVLQLIGQVFGLQDLTGFQIDLPSLSAP